MTPVLVALRRLRARPLQVGVVIVALAAAAALVGWSSLRAGVAQERNTRVRLAEVAPGRRALTVVYHLTPDRVSLAPRDVGRFFRRFAALTEQARAVRVFSPIAPRDERGVRLVVASAPVLVQAGRRPGGCSGRRCEALALAGRYRLGERVALGGGTVAVVVGRGGLELPRRQLGLRALLVLSAGGPLRPLLRDSGVTVSTTAALVPARVHATGLRQLHERLRGELVRLERHTPLLKARAPLALLDDIADRGDVARERLLLVAGQAAALIVAFAAFAATTRRRETALGSEQLATLGASRGQIVVVRLVEAVLPALVAVLVAVAGLQAAAHSAGVPLALATVVAMVGLIAAAALLLFAVAGASPRARFDGPGALEVAALTALGILIWQTASSGALDPERLVARQTSPVLLLLPALAFFAAGVILLRGLPVALRVGERLARRAPFGARLALLSAARRPALAAAATAFLAVAVGTALFSLDYRETLLRQAGEEARFTAAAPWRVRDVVAGMPVMRLRTPTLEVVALPARAVPGLLGWRADFSDLSRRQIARRLRPRLVRLSGPRVAADAAALRLWARATAAYPRIVVAHFLVARDQRFVSVRVGVAQRRWRRLRVVLPHGARGAELIGIDLSPTGSPERAGAYVELGRIEQQRQERWQRLPSLAGWRPGDPHESLAARGFLSTWRTRGAPIPRALRFDLNQTALPLLRPGLELPDALPALASGPVAASAVDGVLDLQLAGRDLRVRVAGTAQRFPSVVERPSRFVVVDYDTLFAALNLDRPGLAQPSERWRFDAAPPGVPADRVVGVAPLQARLLGDPLAAGTRELLGVAAWLAALLAVASLAIATRSTLATERALLAEYEALGVPPRTLTRSTQLSLALLAAFGVTAGFLGALLAVRLVGALIAVTATATRPLLPIEGVVAWAAGATLLVAVTAASLAAVALLAAGALRESPARRLRG